MTRSEAIDMLWQIREYLTAGNPIWRTEPIREACDMAIEALSAEPTQTNDSNALDALDCVDTISRAAAIRWIKTECNPYGKPTLEYKTSCRIMEHLKQMPSASPRWIPVKTRPMDEEERRYYREYFGWGLTDEDAVAFDCKMPSDGQEVWVCSKCGNVWQDTCIVDEGIGLEENGDWLDIVAWMPFNKPQPWKGADDER